MDTCGPVEYPALIVDTSALRAFERPLCNCSKLSLLCFQKNWGLTSRCSKPTRPGPRSPAPPRQGSRAVQLGRGLGMIGSFQSPWIPNTNERLENSGKCSLLYPHATMYAICLVVCHSRFVPQMSLERHLPNFHSCDFRQPALYCFPGYGAHIYDVLASSASTKSFRTTTSLTEGRHAEAGRPVCTIG